MTNQLKTAIVHLSVLLADCVLFLVAFALGLRGVYPIVFQILDLGVVGPGVEPAISERSAMVASISLAFPVFGCMAGLWTRSVVSVLVSSAAMFLVGMTSLAWAMYMVDRGDPAIAWRYIAPQAGEYVGAAIASGAATLGWYLGRRLRGKATVKEPGQVGEA